MSLRVPFLCREGVHELRHTKECYLGQHQPQKRPKSLTRHKKSVNELWFTNDLLPTPPRIRPCRQSVSDTVGRDCGPDTASSAPWEKQRGGTRKTWRRAGYGHAQEPEDTRTGTQSSRISVHAVQKAEDGLYAFEPHQQQPPQAHQTRSTPRLGAADFEVSRTGVGTNIPRLEVLPPAGPDVCSGCFGTSPQQGDGGEVVAGGGARNPRPSPTRHGYSRGARSDASATTSSGSGGRNSSGSGGKRVAHDRRRIATTPVWKRPAVPLSKPYVPVPRKEHGRL